MFLCLFFMVKYRAFDLLGNIAIVNFNSIQKGLNILKNNTIV